MTLIHLVLITMNRTWLAFSFILIYISIIFLKINSFNTFMKQINKIADLIKKDPHPFAKNFKEDIGSSEVANYLSKSEIEAAKIIIEDYS